MGIELENIATDSNWGVEAPKINTNNQKLVTEIIKAQNGEGLIKYYNTSTDLNTLRPKPSNGEQAWVGTPYPGTVWNVVDGVWTDTTVVPDVNTVNLSSYLLNGGTTKTGKQLEDSMKDLPTIRSRSKNQTPEYFIPNPTDIEITWINGQYYDINGVVKSSSSWKRCEPFAIPPSIMYMTNHYVYKGVVASVLFYDDALNILEIISDNYIFNTGRLIPPIGATKIAFSTNVDSYTVDSNGNKLSIFRLVTGRTLSLVDFTKDTPTLRNRVINQTPEYFIPNPIDIEITWINGQYYDINGVVKSQADWKRCEPFAIPPNTMYMTNYSVYKGVVASVLFYDDALKLLEIQDFNYRIYNHRLTPPIGATKVAFSTNIDSKTIDSNGNIVKPFKLVRGVVSSLSEYLGEKDMSDIVVTSFGDSITQQNLWQPLLKNIFKFKTMYNRGIGATTVVSSGTGGAFVDLGQHDGKPGYVVGVQTSVDPDYRPTTGVEGVDWIEIRKGMSSQDRIDTIPDNTGLLLIMGLTNDMSGLSGSLELGTIDDPIIEDDTVVNTVYSSYKKMVKRAMLRLPNARIVVIAPVYCEARKSKYEDCYNVARNVAMLYNLPFISLRNIGINSLNWTTYTPDGVHPNATGATMLAETIANHLASGVYSSGGSITNLIPQAISQSDFNSLTKKDANKIYYVY